MLAMIHKETQNVSCFNICDVHIQICENLVFSFMKKNPSCLSFYFLFQNGYMAIVEVIQQYLFKGAE